MIAVIRSDALTPALPFYLKKIFLLYKKYPYSYIADIVTVQYPGGGCIIRKVHCADNR